ncbi:hypothetical protein [Pseudonocardia aurantiaca]|uniref:Uncharacterized protein n=1 Tax=Pseudonocardia aurantiaca TaxID=75290 RepID=A0ABW4FY89_9PSEU
MLQVLLFGCGWPRPDLGLARWLDAGRPSTDARLALVDRWWGADVVELVAWSPGLSFPKIVERVAVETVPGVTLQPLPAEWINKLNRAAGWDGQLDGWGNDSMHLQMHVITPVAGTASHRFVAGLPRLPSEPGRGVLLLDEYLGWYATLYRVGDALPPTPSGRSWQIDVVCRPLGWLGTYRKSRLSGRWFAGRHRWHELGCP